MKVLHCLVLFALCLAGTWMVYVWNVLTPIGPDDVDGLQPLGIQMDPLPRAEGEELVAPTPHPLALEIRQGMQDAFRAYQRDAWKADEYKPVTRNGENTFGGKGLTIIDSLDTLWLMGLLDEFEAGRTFVRDTFVFEGPINVFENNIRVLGGL